MSRQPGPGQSGEISPGRHARDHEVGDEIAASHTPLPPRQLKGVPLAERQGNSAAIAPNSKMLADGRIAIRQL
jgi:hypothetical protein